MDDKFVVYYLNDPKTGPFLICIQIYVTNSLVILASFNMKVVLNIFGTHLPKNINPA
jgi:hypothetical protein